MFAFPSLYLYVLVPSTSFTCFFAHFFGYLMYVEGYLSTCGHGRRKKDLE